MQIDYFSPYFPELVENREDILNLIQVEEDRYYRDPGPGQDPGRPR